MGDPGAFEYWIIRSCGIPVNDDFLAQDRTIAVKHGGERPSDSRQHGAGEPLITVRAAELRLLD